MNAKVLITGASGFVGATIARRLVSKGVRIRVASRAPASIAGLHRDAVLMPSPGAGADAWQPLLRGVSHVIHCAGVAHGDRRTPDSVYFAANAVLTGELAEAAAATISGRLVFLSSIRAVVGPASTGVVDDATTPAPEGPYGRSKLEGEERVRAAFAEGGRYTILRPVLIYGANARGNFATLLRLAQAPIRLPLANLRAERSVLCIQSCIAAMEHVLDSSHCSGRTFVVADCYPLSTAAMLSALRRGFGRESHLPAAPLGLLSAVFIASGQKQTWHRLSQPLIVNPSGLASTGWKPVADTAVRLEALARQMHRAS